MAEFQKPKTKAEFDANFEQIKPLMNDTQAFYESSRCLFCYDAPCVKACPTSIDIPLFIRQINTENVSGAAKTIYDSNWMGNACGKVCPTEVLCEGACVYNHQEVPPIEIGRLQNYATDQVIENDAAIFTKKEAQKGKVGIIGAGPAGISVACELSKNGFEVEIFEAKKKASGLTVYGVAPYKITNHEALKEIDYLQKQFGFTIHFNKPIQTAEDIKNLEGTFDAIFLGIGLGETNKLNIAGENLENVHGATEYIEKLRMQQHQENSIGKKVIVLGGGNTAMDAASEASRMGAETVILAYRRGKNEKGAYDFEYDLAKSVGTKGLFNVSPIEILGENKVEAVKFRKTDVVDGRVKSLDGSEFIEECDTVILATGQSKLVDFLKMIPNLELDQKGRIQTNTVSYQTSNEKYFAAGDAVNGGAEVVNAAAEGKKAAHGIMNYLGK